MPSLQLVFVAESLLLLLVGITAILYCRAKSTRGMGPIYKTVISVWTVWAILMVGVYLLTKEKVKTETSSPETITPLSQPESLSILTVSDDGGGFGGKRKQNQRNRRTRRINRKNGVGNLVILDRCQLAVVEEREANNG